ncbi:hypothetical protein RvVAT039_06430 [Agrobacterium vitis]|nr:hypothetical protein RvVAT039_06430 [Agrobacterium vitis]
MFGDEADIGGFYILNPRAFESSYRLISKNVFQNPVNSLAKKYISFALIEMVVLMLAFGCISSAVAIRRPCGRKCIEVSVK